MRLTINYNDKSMEKGRAFARSRGEGGTRTEPEL